MMTRQTTMRVWRTAGIVCDCGGASCPTRRNNMSATKILAVGATMAAMVATPAWALPGNVHGNPGHGNQSGSTVTTPGPNASLPAKAKAYGVACNKESKKHVAGQKSTPLSQCGTPLA